MRLSQDLHTHTLYSHGVGTPEENVRAAIALGLTRIAISEHGPGHLFYGVRGERLLSLRREVDRLAKAYQRDIEVLMGIEANLTAFGRCDIPDGEVFDVRILGFHKGIWPGDKTARRCLGESLGLCRNDPADTANALLAAGERYNIHIFSHPSLYALADVDVLSKGAAELGILLEINAHHPTWSAEEVSRAASYGARFTINSDAHRPADVGNLKKGLARAEAAGLTAEQIEGAAERRTPVRK